MGTLVPSWDQALWAIARSIPAVESWVANVREWFKLFIAVLSVYRHNRSFSRVSRFAHPDTRRNLRAKAANYFQKTAREKSLTQRRKDATKVGQNRPRSRPRPRTPHMNENEDDYWCRSPVAGHRWELIEPPLPSGRFFGFAPRLVKVDDMADSEAPFIGGHLDGNGEKMVRALQHQRLGFRIGFARRFNSTQPIRCLSGQFGQIGRAHV